MGDDRDDDRGRADAEARTTSCASRSPAISAGSSPATPSSTRRNTAGREPFEGLCAQIVADFVNKYDPKRERCWIAEMDGENVGCVLLVKDSDDGRAAAPAAGRSGGARARARHAADRRMRPLRPRRRLSAAITLWTHSVLTAARHIYEQAGFRLTSSEKRKSFGQDVVGEYLGFGVVQSCPA